MRKNIVLHTKKQEIEFWEISIEKNHLAIHKFVKTVEVY